MWMTFASWLLAHLRLIESRSPYLLFTHFKHFDYKYYSSSHGQLPFKDLPQRWNGLTLAANSSLICHTKSTANFWSGFAHCSVYVTRLNLNCQVLDFYCRNRCYFRESMYFSASLVHPLSTSFTADFPSGRNLPGSEQAHKLIALWIFSSLPQRYPLCLNYFSCQTFNCSLL